MSWLNTPESIVEDYRVIKETQGTWYTNDEGGLSYEERYRLVTWTTTRYVGCDYTAAKAKADGLAAAGGYDDIHLIAMGGGQYHCVATQKVEGDWSAWEDV